MLLRRLAAHSRVAAGSRCRFSGSSAALHAAKMESPPARKSSVSFEELTEGTGIGQTTLPILTERVTEPASSGVAAGQQQAATTPEPLVREEQIPKASRLARLLDHNREFVASKKYEDYHSKKAGSSRAVVITCMDSRLIELLPKAMNIRSGEAKIIKTAGAILTHPFGGIMRSVLIAIFELHADEVFVVAHHDCGMNNINPAKTLEKMVDVGGIAPETLHVLEYAGINVKRWLHGFDSVYESVHNSVAVIRNHPLMPAHIPIHGLVIDPHTGALEVVVDGYSLAGQTPEEAHGSSNTSAAAHGSGSGARLRPSASASSISSNGGGDPASPLKSSSSRRSDGKPQDLEEVPGFSASRSSHSEASVSSSSRSSSSSVESASAPATSSSSSSSSHSGAGTSVSSDNIRSAFLKIRPSASYVNLSASGGTTGAQRPVMSRTRSDSKDTMDYYSSYSTS